MAFHFLNIDANPIIKPEKDSFFVTLDGKRCTTKKRLLTEIGSLFHFANYYGQNFDALSDCFENLEGIESAHIYWHIINYQWLCVDENESQQLETFYEVIKNVLAFYATHTTQITIIAPLALITKITPPHFA